MGSAPVDGGAAAEVRDGADRAPPSHDPDAHDPDAHDPDAALARACEVLARAERVLLTSHRRPDGDGTGSMAGLASLLRAAGKTAVIYSLDPIARRYKWLPLIHTTVQTISFDERFDCTIVVDCADITLLGDTLPPPEVCGTLITLDHHASGRPFGDIAVWDPAAAAVGVLVHRLALRQGWPVTVEAAVPLYVSLISDTYSGIAASMVSGQPWRTAIRWTSTPTAAAVGSHTAMSPNGWPLAW